MSSEQEHGTVGEANNVKKIHPHPRLHDVKLHPKPHVKDHAAYADLYKESIEQPTEFWGRMARENLSWDRDFKTVQSGSFEDGDVAWFLEGELNACYNCVDRHAHKNPDSVALIYEADEPGEGRNITYKQLLRDVCQLANTLKAMGVKKGDVVTIYMPMIPETIVAFLAIIRLGAVHSVVFAGFSSESLRDRIHNGKSKFVLTSDEGKRGGKNIGTKRIVDDALKQCPDVKHCLVFKRTGSEVPWTEGRDYWWDEEVKKYPGFCPCTPVSSEDPLFLLYTSGSTGAPKGVLHTTAGYLLGAAMTLKYIFDVHPGDKIGTAGDVGWITGHTYVVYAPLLLGVATLVFEGTPAYPSFSRYWEIVEQHKITHWYVAPTAIRLLKRAGDEHVKGDLSSLRMLGSVGEPIAPEVFQWYSSVVGKDQCSVVDTYWQTETGSHIIAPLSAAVATKPGSASLPFFGIEPALVDPEKGTEIQGNDVEGVLVIKRPWPSMARTVYGAHDRYMDTYLKPYPGYYFTGDGAGRDHDGYYWIRGRVDDVVNVSGHRLSTAEIEAALIQYNGVGESAAVGYPNELTGQSIAAFVQLKSGVEASDQLKKDLILQVRKSIGPFAAPSKIFFTELPKTRSGKIMRRILRKVCAGESSKEQLGDTSTLQNPEVVDDIVKAVGDMK
ncbi:acetyl-coenzyme A synthetase [Protomyces lactucae-debilis]|uniref:Acetyl-coenzyme A synthetase n=1 Tax=Protomyces lactucae-debilis TaxID=2754530 RepID=A0A1Y2FAI8_PROLT|nr:acetyl-coenzyme A synthetase [Protomyces lactucae-debilis]ORY80929.1 acetyl-coenzyme A synthetase [Protomyces lactucae-debilis]